MILSLSELYVFLGLPIHVVRNGSFDEGLDYWNAEMIEGEELVSVLLGDGSNQHPSDTFHCTLTLSRINMTWPAHNYMWAKVYQLLSEHQLVESSTLKFRMMITKTDFERLSSESDAAMIYVGFMISRGLEKEFLIYAWVLFETHLTRITADTFNELAFWRIVRLEKFDQRLSGNFEITFTTSIWKDLERQENLGGGDWKIGHERAEGIEIGIMLWNVETSDFSWGLNLYLGHLDITYYWLDSLTP